MSMKNVPNILTVSRIFAVLVFVVLATFAEKSFMSEQAVMYVRLAAYILAILAGLTDLLDGYLARRYNIVSDFGALMDPLADKVFITATMLMAVEYQLMPAWIAVLVISREFMVTGLRTMAAKNGIVISADRWGKLKTALQMLMLALCGASWVGWYDLHHTVFRIGSAEVRLWSIWLVFLTGIVLVTVLSGLGYFIRYRHVFLAPKGER